MKNETDTKADLELFEEIQQGGEEAFEVLFRKYYTPLYRFASRIINDPQEAENIVQDLFVRFWEKRLEIKITASVKSYLYTAVKNHALNYIKRERKLTLLDDNPEFNNGSIESPESALIKDETFMAVHSEINKLPDKCREIYLMKKSDDLSYQEISDILKISVNTVKTQMKRAVKSLTRNLDHLKVSLLLIMLEIKGLR